GHPLHVIDALPPGLSSTEARRRLLAGGPNVLAEARPGERLRELARTLGDPMALMLVGAAGVSFLLGQTRDAAVLLVALVPGLGEVSHRERDRAEERVDRALARLRAPPDGGGARGLRAPASARRRLRAQRRARGARPRERAPGPRRARAGALLGDGAAPEDPA